MRKAEIKQKAGDMVREAIREKELADNATVLSPIPDALSSVSIDINYILGRVDNELNKRTANPLNALLSLFGLRIVHTKTAINDLSAELGGDFSVSLEVADAGQLTSLLRVDEKQLKSAISRMADELHKAESKQQSVQQSLREQNAALHKEMDKTAGELAQKSTDFNYQKNAVAERVQYMLSLAGESPADQAMSNQIKELLEDLELSAHWTNAGTKLKDSVMFSVLKCDDPTKRRSKPCIMAGSEVFLKGVRFVADSDTGAQPSQGTAAEAESVNTEVK